MKMTAGMKRFLPPVGKRFKWGTKDALVKATKANAGHGKGMKGRGYEMERQ